MTAEPSAGPETAVPPPAGERRVHIYEAASDQREKVMKGFDTQREALLKAVADQRESALAPIRAVQSRQAAVAGVDGRVLGPRGNAMALSQTAVERNQTIAEIAAAIRALIAEEVTAQLTLLLRDADARVRAATQPEPPLS